MPTKPASSRLALLTDRGNGGGPASPRPNNRDVANTDNRGWSLCGPPVVATGGVSIAACQSLVGPLTSLHIRRSPRVGGSTTSACSDASFYVSPPTRAAASGLVFRP